MWRRAWLFLTILSCIALLPACGSSTSSDSPDTLDFAVSIGPRTWDPHPETRKFALGWYSLVYDGLLRRDADGNLQPGLATDWKVTPKKVTLTLREGVQFQDGSSFNAKAVAWNIKQAKKVESVVGLVFSKVEEVETVDPQHIALHLKEPAPGILAQLASFGGLMVSPAVSTEDLQRGMPAGTGPYRVDVEKSTPEEEWVFTKNLDYWNPDAQHFERVVGQIISDDAARANALATGRVDAAFVRANQAEQIKQEGMEVREAPVYETVFQIMDLAGQQVPALKDARVRRALAHAINPEAFIQTARSGYGEPARQLFAENELGHVADGSPYAYDPEQAKKLLAEAGASDLTFSVPAFGPFKEGAIALQSMFKQVGVTMKIDSVAPGEMTPKIASGDYPAVYTYVSGAHPQSVYLRYLDPGTVYNPLGEKVDAVEAAEKEALKHAGDKDKLAADYGSMFAAVYQEAWIVPISRGVSLVAFDPDRLSSVKGWTGVASFFYVRGAEPA